MIKFKYKFLLVLLIMIIIELVGNVSVDALTTSTTGITSVGASTIVIDSAVGFDVDDPTSVSTTGDLTYLVRDNGYVAIYWDVSSISANGSLYGTYTVKYENCGYDSDGDTIDLTVTSKVTTTNIYSSAISWDSDIILLIGYLHGSDFSLYSVFKDSDTYKDTSDFSYAVYFNTDQIVTATITKHGTTTTAEGNYVFYVNDIDAVKSSPRYTESITLGSGFNSTVYLESDTTIDVSDDGLTYTATEGDENTPISSFTTLVTSPFSFSWQGNQCGTTILESFGTSTITSKIYTSKDGGSSYDESYAGGSITAKNTTSNYSVLSQTSNHSKTITTYWKNSYTYYTSANEGYHLAKIIYDGTTSTSSTSRKFSSVTDTHTFYAYYVANSYTVKFNRK